MDNVRLSVMAAMALVMAPSLHAQNLIINGDFEINTASECDFNLDNIEFNATVSNATAFGTAEEIDVMTAADGCGFGSPPQSGDTKLAIHSQSPGGRFDAFSLDLSSPIVAGNTYTLVFYAEPVFDFSPDAGAVEVGLSNNPTDFGTLVFTATYSRCEHPKPPYQVNCQKLTRRASTDYTST